MPASSSDSILAVRATIASLEARIPINAAGRTIRHESIRRLHSNLASGNTAGATIGNVARHARFEAARWNAKDTRGAAHPESAPMIAEAYKREDRTIRATFAAHCRPKASDLPTDDAPAPGTMFEPGTCLRLVHLRAKPATIGVPLAAPLPGPTAGERYAMARDSFVHGIRYAVILATFAGFLASVFLAV